MKTRGHLPANGAQAISRLKDTADLETPLESQWSPHKYRGFAAPLTQSISCQVSRFGSLFGVNYPMSIAKLANGIGMMMEMQKDGTSSENKHFVIQVLSDFSQCVKMRRLREWRIVNGAEMEELTSQLGDLGYNQFTSDKYSFSHHPAIAIITIATAIVVAVFVVVSIVTPSSATCPLSFSPLDKQVRIPLILSNTNACVSASTSPLVDALKTLTLAKHPCFTTFDSVGKFVVPHHSTSVALLSSLILDNTKLKFDASGQWSVEGKFTLTLTFVGRIVPSATVSACTNWTPKAAYVRAARLSAEFGLDSRVVYDTWEPVAAEKAIEGIPSRAASHAAPLCNDHEKS